MNVRYLDLAAFRDEGYLQEVNRLLLHPCGLALEMTTAAEVPLRHRPLEALRAARRAAAEVLRGKVPARLSGVWDYRDDPEGMAFSAEPNREKVLNVLRQWHSKRETRLRGLGFHVQPPEGGDVTHPPLENAPPRGDYADGHASGDRDRFARCRQDLARLLGRRVDSPEEAPPWEDLLQRVKTLCEAGESLHVVSREEEE